MTNAKSLGASRFTRRRQRISPGSGQSLIQRRAKKRWWLLKRSCQFFIFRAVDCVGALILFYVPPSATRIGEHPARIAAKTSALALECPQIFRINIVDM